MQFPKSACRTLVPKRTITARPESNTSTAFVVGTLRTCPTGKLFCATMHRAYLKRPQSEVETMSTAALVISCFALGFAAAWIARPR